MLAVKRTAPIEDLYLLNVSDYIKNNVIITDNEQEQRLQLKKICNFIETEIISKLHCTTTKLSHESFDIDSPDFKGPINYLNPSQKEELENVFLQCKEAAIKNIFILITKCIFFGEERIGVNSQTISNTIAHQMWVQILSNLFPSIFYKPAIGDKPLYQQSLIKYKSIVDKLPAIGNSVVWISKQQTYNINGKRIYCPEYVELWMDCFLKALTNPASSRNTLIQSVKLLNLVLDSAKENKEELDRANISAKISVDSFITLIAILKSDDINSEIRQKSPELFDDVSKAYETLKSLLFDQTTNVIQFKESMSSVFQILYFYLLSDPNASNQTFDNTVLDEFSNVIILTLAKYPDVYNEWVKIYKQYQNQPKNIHLTKTIVNKIQNQQNEYLQKGEQLPIENRWRSLDNDAFKKILYEIIFLSEGQDSNPETEEMRKSIKSIIGGGPEEVIETVEIVEPVETEPRSGNVTRSVEIQHPNEYETIIIETIETIETEQPEEHVRTVKTIQTQPEVHVKTIETVENVEPQTEVLNRNAETQPEVNVETIETVENQPQTHTRTVKTVKTIRTVETQQGGSVKTVESQPEVHVETIETVENVEPQTETLDRNAETQPEPEVHVETVETVENVEPQPEVLDRTAEAQPEVNVETIETVENQPGVNVKTIKTIKTIRTVETQQGGSRTIESQPEVHVETIETVENVEPQTETLDRNAETQPEVHIETIETVENVETQPEPEVHIETIETTEIVEPQTETLDRNAETQPEVHVETIETVENVEPQTEVLDRTAETQPEVNVETIETVENQPGVNVKTIKTIKTIRTVETQQGGSRTIESQPEVHVETIETVENVEPQTETLDRNAETQPEPEVHVETVETVENVEPQPEVLDRTAEAQPEVNVETIETVENQPGVNVKTIKTIKTIRTVETQQEGSRTIESQPEVHVETIETVENVEPQTETLDRNAETQPEVHIETIETVENIEPQTEVLDRTAEAQPEVNVETIENVENQPGVNVKTIKTIKTIRTVETQQGGSRTIESQPEVHVETIETVEVQPEESNYGVVEEEIETSDRSATEVGEENENNGINVYFEKPYYWGNEIYSYVYKYEDDFTPVFIKEWPGVRIYPIGGEGDIYYYTLDKSYYDGRHRILFSDGSHQVSDVLIEGFDLIRNALYNERGFDRICKTVGENNNVLAFGNYIPIYYKPKEQWLKGPIYAHYRIGNGKWTQAPGQEMTYILNGEEAVLFVKANTNADISVAFTNGEEWDNNYGQNFKVNYINDEPIAATI